MLPKYPTHTGPETKTLSPDAKRILLALEIVLAVLPPPLLSLACERLSEEGFDCGPPPAVPPLWRN